MENLVPIGRFSRITGLSVKALRLYDELGLLPPATVDRGSGYRYYRLGQANRAEAIRLLRSLDVPLDEVAAMLAEDDPARVAAMLEAHRASVEERVVRSRRILAYLQRLTERKEGVMPYEVIVKDVPEQQVAALREHLSAGTVGSVIGEGIGRVFAAIGRSGAAPAGPPTIVYHGPVEQGSGTGPDEQAETDVDICVPIRGDLAGGGAVSVLTLPGGPVATTVHRGPYDEIRPAYHTLAGWIQEHGHEVAGPPREVYLTDPNRVSDPVDFVTEIDWPIG